MISCWIILRRRFFLNEKAAAAADHQADISFSHDHQLDYPPTHPYAYHSELEFLNSNAWIMRTSNNI